MTVATVSQRDLAPSASVQERTDRINRVAGRLVEDIITVGRELHEAKSALAHGEWEKLFDPTAIERPVRFSLRMAQMFMKIADHPALAKAKHVSSLPTTIGALYELTKLDEPALRTAIESGEIHAEMTRADAVTLHRADRKNHVPAEPTWFDSKGEPIPATFKVSAEIIQDAAKSIQALAAEDSLRAFAGNDEIASDLALAVQEFYFALDLAWKQTHARDGVYRGVQVRRDGLHGPEDALHPAAEAHL